jgi:hypothetical protein
MARVDHARAGLTIRCAIYPRKSSDEGLNQEFNSLDAQREACEAYIVSQRHAGWVALANMYDDGGLSGGTMERPALKRLLEDIKAGKVQIVVVYKVDRLTRSLADFAKIVDIFDIFDAHNASFVSVTQQFNTTVLVDADGFEWNGRRYRSLTIVAVRSLGPLVGSPFLRFEEGRRPLRRGRANMRGPDRPKSGAIFRCAIYTRKSS